MTIEPNQPDMASVRYYPVEGCRNRPATMCTHSDPNSSTSPAHTASTHLGAANLGTNRPDIRRMTSSRSRSGKSTASTEYKRHYEAHSRTRRRDTVDIRPYRAEIGSSRHRTANMRFDPSNSWRYRLDSRDRRSSLVRIDRYQLNSFDIALGRSVVGMYPRDS